MSVRVGVGQFAATTDKEANRGTVTALIGEAAAAGAELLVLPEMSMYLPTSAAADLADASEPLDGPFGAAVSAAAKEHGIAVVAGMFETLDGTSRVANTVVAVDAMGERTGLYRKVHLYDAFGYRESDTVQPGDFAPLTFALGGLTFGVMTCYDLRFPEIARALVDAGGDVLVVPAAWMVGPAKEDHWATLTRARAIENTTYAVVSGQTGPHCTAQSMVIDPMGVVIASAGEAPGVVVAELTRERIEAVRAKNPSLANRRFTVSAKD